MDRRTALIVAVISVAVVGAAWVLRLQRNDPGTASPAPTTVASTEPGAAVTTTTTTPTTTIADDAIVCDRYQSVTVAGPIESGGLIETSGIAASRRSPGVVWAHNDSGDEARLYAIGPAGEDLGSFTIDGGLAFDWEDVAIGPGPTDGDPHLYVGDIGDNFGIRQGRVTVYVVREPDPSALSGTEPLALELVLDSPDGAQNFEALFVADGSIFVATKDDETTSVYQGTPLDGSPTVPLELIATIELGAEVTAADVSWDGSVIAFRGYETVWLWSRRPGDSVANALATEPCMAPSPEERQGEALAFLADGTIATVSEGSNVVLHLVRRDS